MTHQKHIAAFAIAAVAVVVALFLLLPVQVASLAASFLAVGAVTAHQNVKKHVPNNASKISYPVAASTTVYGDTLAFVNSSGYLHGGTTAATDTFAGLVVIDVDNSSGSNGDENAECFVSGPVRVLLTGSGFAITDVNQKVYAVDNFTVSLSATANPLVGTIKEYVSATQVWVELESQEPEMPYLHAAQQALSGAGAITVTEYYTAWTTTGADAGTLADGTRPGQLKKIQLIVDGGDGTLTPSNLAGGTTITFADAGDFAILLWDGSTWTPIELGNGADGATAPVLA